MIPVSQDWRDAAAKAGATPVVELLLTNAYGRMVYGISAPSNAQVQGTAGPFLADGSVMADGTVGGDDSVDILDVDGLIAQLGPVREALSPRTGDAWGGLQRQEVGSLSVTLANKNNLGGKLMAWQNLVGAQAEIVVGFDGVAPGEFMRRFQGEVQSARVSRESISLQIAATGPSMPLSEDYRLRRAGDYANPRRAAETICVVHGDMTANAGGRGQWVAPCIDTSARVYALAGTAIATVAQGQSLTLYNRDGEELGSGYTFSAANDYESQGEIATAAFPSLGPATDISFETSDNSINSTSIDLSALGANWMLTVSGSSSNDGEYKVASATSTKALLYPDREVATESAGASITLAADQERNEPITVIAKGRVDSTGSLITNPVDQAKDFLLTLCGYSAHDLEATGWLRAAATCDGLGYAAAGVLDRDRARAEILTEMLAEFGVSWWEGSRGRIKLVVDYGPAGISEAEVAGVLREPVTRDAQVSQDLSLLCNQCPVEFAYNWADREFQESDDGSTKADAKSQAMFGVRSRPLKLVRTRTAAVAQAIQEAQVETYAYPRMELEVAEPGLCNAPVERGDTVWLSASWLYDAALDALTNQIVRVQAVALDFSQALVRFTLHDTGKYRTVVYLADGSVVADGTVGNADRDTVEL